MLFHRAWHNDHCALQDKNEAIDIHEFKKGMSRCDSVCVSLNVMNTVCKSFTT